MAISVEQCAEMVDAVERTGRLLAVNHILRYNPRFQAAKRIIDSGLLGQPFYAEGDYIHYVERLVTEGWRGDVVHNHHPLLGGACHTIDLLRWFVGEVEEVAGYGSHIAIPAYPFDDCMVCVLRFENGAVGKCAGIFGCRRPSVRNVQVYGTQGTYLSGEEQDLVFLSDHPENRIELRQPVAGHPFDIHVNDFVECVLQRRQPLLDVYEGANVVCVAEAGAQAIASGKPAKPRRFRRK